MARLQLEYNRTFSNKVKSRANYTCQECGSAELVQAHAPNGDHSDWTKGIALCALCHAEEHPGTPKELFLAERSNSLWPNITAASLARELQCPKGSVIRVAVDLGINFEKPLSDRNKKRIAIGVIPRPKVKKILNQCTDCGSYHVIKAGFGIYRYGKAQRIKCQDCGSIFLKAERPSEVYKTKIKEKEKD